MSLKTAVTLPFRLVFRAIFLAAISFSLLTRTRTYEPALKLFDWMQISKCGYWGAFYCPHCDTLNMGVNAKYEPKKCWSCSGKSMPSAAVVPTTKKAK